VLDPYRGVKYGRPPRLLLVVALAKGFEEDYAGGDGNVQGFDGAGGGQGDDEIAALAS
jgi:hypothetical protein